MTTTKNNCLYKQQQHTKKGKLKFNQKKKKSEKKTSSLQFCVPQQPIGVQKSKIRIQKFLFLSFPFIIFVYFLDFFFFFLHKKQQQQQQQQHQTLYDTNDVLYGRKM